MFELAVVVAVISWTVTHEAVFKEWQDFTKRLVNDPSVPFVIRKVAYPWTCEFCFSFWATFLTLMWFDCFTIVNFFVVVAEANLLMSLWFTLRLFIRWLGAQSK